MTDERLEYWRNCFSGLFSTRDQIAELHDQMREELTAEIDLMRAEIKGFKELINEHIMDCPMIIEYPEAK